MEAAALLAEHQAAGRAVDVGGVSTFVRDEGGGPDAQTVLLVHGVPVSSWVWRRLLPALAARGLRAVAPDLPGTGLSGRPEHFDYSWTGLGRHLTATVEALGLDAVHLVVHDIGGPVGFEFAAAVPERIRSVTVLDTIVTAHTFRKPWPMAPFAVPVLGGLWLRGTSRLVLRTLIRTIGLVPGSIVSNAEIDVHHRLLRQTDGGKAFLKIMRSFETTADKTRLYSGVLAAEGRPVQVLWGRDDPALRADHHGKIAAHAAGIPGPTLLPGRHFLMEDSPEPIAEHVAGLVTR
ncbi:epoxide hydrolase [Longimycelium tulufanense]|uniref:Epoxide hydrolase n=1 Tax=Longimycelium tulufanense TaxID=907463 RepID=A0A8J3FWU3_9PSEU|nr:alpha/beta fold hydrolase [Longimycelium tulufanense]GGM62746.1 epoxide hydrolase [Longimycelium tulufanense]